MTLLVALLGTINGAWAQQPFTKDITGYSESENENGGYYLIAMPIDAGEEGVSPTSVDGMITDDFDLYYFDESQEKEWINYISDEEGNVNPNFGDLVSGKGYLYASKDGSTLTFTGMALTEGGRTIDLNYHEGSAFAGWNLIGNPFATNAFCDRYFYRMNDDGSELIADYNGSEIEPMEGIFVYAEEDGQILTFTTEPESRSVDFALTLSRAGHGAIDRTIIRFGESHYLPKFQLRKNSTKLFIKQDKQEFAVVSGDASCQMPVGFKAEHDGSYTISLSNSGVEFSYLHLVDLLTGKDIDLLAHPDYTFDARTTDDASRFRLDYTATTTNVANVQRSPFRELASGGILLPQHGLQGNQDANKTDDPEPDDPEPDDPEPDDPEPQTMEIALTAGWNWFSTNCDITLDDLKAALVEALPQTNITILSQTQNTKYNGWTNRWTGRLSWDVAQMYMIQVNADCEITLEGMSIDPAEHTVTIYNEDNWIGFPFAQSMSVANAFGVFAVEGDVIISQTASACYTNGTWKGTLKNLEPGQGYIYKSASTEDRIFVYPAGGDADSGSNDSFNFESHWPDFYYHSYQYNRPFVAAIMIDGKYVTAEDYDYGLDGLEVAAFVGEECRGNRFTLTNRYVEEYGEPYPVLDGMPVYYDNPGQVVTFKLYDHVNGIEYNDCVILYQGELTPITTGEDRFEGWSDYENPIILSFTTPAVAFLELSDTGENAGTIEGYDEDENLANVILKDRTLYKDEKWNTLCLPFNIVLDGSPLEDAEARYLYEANITEEEGGTTLNLTFSEPVDELMAGTPYIIKWESGDALTEDDLKFYDVTINKTDNSYDNKVEGDTRVRFLGTYDAITFDGEGFTEDRSILFLGDGDKLYYPQVGVDEQNNPVYPFIGACRAYFKIGEDGATARQLTAFNLNFGDGSEQTGISEQPILNSQFSTLHSEWYTLSGMKVDKPTRKGVYIQNGKMVVVK